MQPIKHLTDLLRRFATKECYLFSLYDLRSAFPEQSQGAFKVMISRAEKAGLIKRVCRGVYLYPWVAYPAGLVLFHTAAKIRADAFNYLSLETVLSDAGVISQIPMNWITLISSGRSSILNCGDFGHIEFIHTKRSVTDLARELSYDPRCRLWRGSVCLALKEMQLMRRNLDLIDWEAADEFV